MAKDLAIVLNNGSVNSAVTAALAAQKFRTILLHVESSPLPGSRARAAYDQQVAHFKPFREHSLSMPFLALIEPDPKRPKPISDPRTPSPQGKPLHHFLPLIASAARFAAHYQASAIYLGLRVGSLGDELANTTEYVQIWNELLQLPCNLPELEVIMPLLELDEWQVIDLGVQVSAPLERTWSCEEETGEPCWACRGCRSRELAFQQAAKPDPLRVVRKV